MSVCEVPKLFLPLLPALTLVIVPTVFPILGTRRHTPHVLQGPRPLSRLVAPMCRVPSHRTHMGSYLFLTVVDLQSAPLLKQLATRRHL